jgi:hypothetical protein
VAYEQPTFSERLRNSFDPLGLSIAWTLLASFVGTLLTIAASAIAPIPIVGLVAFLFIPFPTMLIYFGIIFLFYLISLAAPLGRLRGFVGCLMGVLVVAAIAFGYPEMVNHSFDAQLEQYKQRGEWSPIVIADGSSVTLVRSMDTGIDKGCDSFCYGLLLSGRASRVTIMTAPAFRRVEDLNISGKKYELVDGADKCISSLAPMYSPNLPSTSDQETMRLRLEGDFKIGVLNDAFEDGLRRCLSIREVENEHPSGWLLVNWQNELNYESYDLPMPTVNARVSVVDARSSSPKVTELFEIYGSRVSTPAWIWPYGGNAGSGGTFSPILATEQVDWRGPDLSLDGWWGFVADPNAIIRSAIDRVEQAS